MPAPFDQRSALADPSAWSLGRYWDKPSQTALDKLLYAGNEPIIVIGRNRSGKDSGIGTYNALSLINKSMVYIDPRGETAAISAPYRRTLGPVFCLNPFDVVAGEPQFRGKYADLKSTRYNPLRFLNPDSPRFFEDCLLIAEALILIEGTQPHFNRAARGLALGFLMHEVREARRERRAPSLWKVRAALTQPDVYDAQGRLIKGLAINCQELAAKGYANELSAKGYWQIASLLGRYSADNDETQGVRATADALTIWLLSDAMRRDLDDGAGGGLDMRLLGDRACTCFVILPPEMISETHSPWVRLVITSAMRALFRPRPDGVVCSFWLNEFRILGELRAVADSMGLLAGYGIQPIPVLQSLSQLTIYDKEWENFIGQAGAMLHVGRTGDNFTAEYLSKYSGEMTIRNPSTSITYSAGGPPSLNRSESFMQRPYLMPQDLMRIRDRFGFVWRGGRVIPAYFPGYFDVDLLDDRGGRASRNPYYKG